jgi:tRNA pseudouridine55 synthase
MMDGILLIDKPKGWTSFDVVAKIRGQFKRETGLKKPKVGHTGTLDPLATGLMIIVIGSYCKRAEEFSKLDKSYEVTLILGQTSTTGDAEGVKTKTGDWRPKTEDLKAALAAFKGDIMQTPPIYSAIKVNGQRAYKLARAGKEVKLEPRKVMIYQISDIKYSYPSVTFTVRVSSGTYIRSLVEDIGKKLGTGAYMTDLRRTEVGNFTLQKAVSVEKWTTQDIIEI